MSLLVDSARRGAADRQAGLVLRIDNAPPRASACGRAHRPQDSTTRRVAIISAGPASGDPRGRRSSAQMVPDRCVRNRVWADSRICPLAAIAARPLTATSSRWVAVSGDVMPQTRRHPSVPRGRASERRSRALWDGVCFVGARREPSLWWREDPWSCSRPARAESDECRRAAHHEGGPPAMKVIRIVPNLSSEAFVASRAFYTAMFDLVVSVELDDWYLQLMPESDTRLNIGFVKPDHELFADRTAPSGTYGVVLTIQVDDVDEAYKRAKRLGAEIAAEIRNEDYGQRHFLLVDPNGLVLNVMSIL